MRIPSPVCLFKKVIGYIRAVWAGYDVADDGHRYVIDEEHRNCRVLFLRCRECGDTTLMWAHESDIEEDEWERTKRGLSHTSSP